MIQIFKKLFYRVIHHYKKEYVSHINKPTFSDIIVDINYIVTPKIDSINVSFLVTKNRYVSENFRVNLEDGKMEHFN